MTTTETDHNDRPDPAGLKYQIAVRTAVVAGVFSLIVCVLLLYDHSRRPEGDLLEDVTLTALKSVYATQPNDEQIKKAIREVDKLAVNEHFRQRAFTAVGTWLLLGGIAVCLIAARSAATLRRKLPTPHAETAPVDVEIRWTRVAGWSVIVLAMMLIAISVALQYGVPSDLPQNLEELNELTAQLDSGSPDLISPSNDKPGPISPSNDKPQPSIEPYDPPSQEEIQKHWPRFRGPGGLGISHYDNVPVSWDGSTGEGILWKTAVPLPGKNSPVVWGHRVFLSGADEAHRQVFCFDADSGKILWQREAPAAAQDPAAVEDFDPEFTGYAAPTTTTDGRLVFAIFATGDLAAFDFDGNLAWSRGFGIPDNSYGHASSLTMYRDLLLVQFDQGGLAKKEKSRFYALKSNTGEIVWEAKRKVTFSWTTPIVIRHQGRDQVITCSDPWVIAYNPADGSELWKAEVLTGDCGPSAVIAGPLVYVGNEYCEWTALRPDGEGDVTETHVEWTAEDGLPDMCCPLATEEFVFLMPSSSYFTCLDAKTGELLWEREFEEDYFTSSPSLAGNRIYLFSNEGKTFIIEPARTLEECKDVGQAALGEECVTSPAFQDGRIYIRGEKHLFCIGKKKE